MVAPDALANLKAHRELSQKFFRKLTLEYKGPAPKELVFGNDKYGYFKTTDVRAVGNSKLVVGLVPPGYRFPLRFLVKVGNKYQEIAQKRLPSPLLPAYKSLEKVRRKGEFSVPFVMVSNTLPLEKLKNPNFKPKDRKIFTKSKFRYTFATIINRFGEIVWLHVPMRKGKVMSRYHTFKKINDNVYGILYGKKSGYFELVRSDGKVLATTDSKGTNDPFPMHHDFHFVGRGKMLTVGNDYGKLKKKLKVAADWKDYLTNTLIQVDVAKATSQVAFDFSRFYQPESTFFDTGDAPDDKKFWYWGKPKADFDFIHINALEAVRGGFLVGLRNLNKIAFIPKDMSRIGWTIGYDKDDTYQIQGDGFYHYHTPRLVGDNQILLFDNGRKRGRSRALLLEFGGRQAKVVWQYDPAPGYYSKNRSSVYPIGKDRVLMLYVSPAEGGAKKPPIPNRDILIEVDRKTNAEVARMILTFQALSPGYRADPLTSIAGEQFVGNSLN